MLDLLDQPFQGASRKTRISFVFFVPSRFKNLFEPRRREEHEGKMTKIGYARPQLSIWESTEGYLDSAWQLFDFTG
ncbi:MAG: hypothetical protein DSM106950_31710 [Stigonema ocellatum SAG 48.90 = DSM 106950]|nr:hypothetical protein [Stigonema ocellatum SAG 48.90 = DSM 106950]